MTPPKLDKERRAWLASLKDGDEVAWVCDYSPALIMKILVGRDYFTGTDEKESHCRATFTKSQGKGRQGARVFRSTSGWIVPVTEELRKEHAVAKYRVQLGRADFSSTGRVDADKILATAAILWPRDFEGKS